MSSSVSQRPSIPGEEIGTARLTAYCNTHYEMALNKNLIPDRSGPGSTTAALSFDVCRGGSEKYATSSQNSKLSITKQWTTIATWNVRTLKDDGKIELLVNEMNTVRWNILGISEMRWVGTGETSTDDGHKVWFSGNEQKHEHEVGFLVEKNTAKSVMECTPVLDRLI